MSKQYDTFRLYHSDGGEKYHRRPGCAIHKFENPHLDGGADMFEQCEMDQLGDIDVTPDEVCENCAPTVKEHLKE